MAKDGLTELARLFKERDKQDAPSITTGVVISPLPDLRIRLNDVVILDGRRLILASHLVSGYKRRIEIAEHQIDAVMEWTDSIQAGDEVILIPVSDGQLYYVIDKAVRV